MRRRDRGITLSINKVLYAMKILIAGLFLQSCHLGGEITQSPPPPPSPELFVSEPTLIVPASNPFFSKEDTLNIMGMCMLGYQVKLSGSFNQEQDCTSFSYHFTLDQSEDGIFPLSIQQISPLGHTSEAISLVWIRKSSISHPVLISPSLNPFSSGQEALSLQGSCENGALIKITGDSNNTKYCEESSFNFSIPKAVDGEYTFSITQTDPAGNSASIQLKWKKKTLTVSPQNPSIMVANSQTFSITGGSGVYQSSLTQNPSSGQFNSVTSIYTAGNVANVRDVLTVTDSVGTQVSVSISTVPGFADHFVLPPDSGDSQTQVIHTELNDPVQIKVVDQFGNGVFSFPVFFQFIRGDAQLLDSPLQLTDAQGYARVHVRTGYSEVLNNLLVSPFGAPLPDVALSGNKNLTLTVFETTNNSGSLGSIFSVGQNSVIALSEDFDKDGNPDIAVLNAGDPSIGILLGKGNGLVKKMTKVLPLCLDPTDLVSADFNLDGNLDFAVTCSSTGRIAIVLGVGDGTFNIPTYIDVSMDFSLLTSLTSNDLDLDGKWDLAFTSAGSATVGVLFGNGDGTFKTPQSYNVGQSSLAIKTTDLNKDGYPDIVFVNSLDNKVGVLMNNKNGTFQNQITYDVGTNPSALYVGDFNSDLFEDLAVVNNGDNTVILLLNNGSGDLVPGNPLSVGNSPTSVAALDSNHDGKLDLAVVSSSDSVINLFLGQGNGNFNLSKNISVINNATFVTAVNLNKDSTKDLLIVSGTEQKIEYLPIQQNGSVGFVTPTLTTPNLIRHGEFNSDSHEDLVVLSQPEKLITLYLNDGTGLFSASTVLNTGAVPFDLWAGDLNGDGHSDILSLDQTTRSLRVYLGKGDTTFEAAVDYSVGNLPTSLTVCDLNKDGKLDVIVANGGADSISVLFGENNGSLRAKEDFFTSSGPSSVICGDFNNDGVMDLAVTNKSANNVSVLLGNGNETFQSHLEYATGSGPNDILSTDFNNDGIIDLAATNNSDGTVSILIGLGNGAFKDKNDYFSGNTPIEIISGDFSGDLRADLMIVNGTDSTFTELRGSANGSFNNSIIHYHSGVSNSLTLGDFNGDGTLDLVITDETNFTLKLYLGY